MSRTADQARTILTDATVLATSIDAALRSLHDSRGGFAASTPGAAAASVRPELPEMSGPCREHGCGQQRPCAEHDSAISLTPTEGAAVTRDPSAVDQARLAEHMRLAMHHTAKAATIAVRWANPALDDSAVARRLKEIDRAIWCHNCAKHGHNNPRRDGRTECRECAEFRTTYGCDRTKAIIDRVARGIALRPDFIAIQLDAEYGPGWRKKMPGPAKGKKRKAA